MATVAHGDPYLTAPQALSSFGDGEAAAPGVSDGVPGPTRSREKKQPRVRRGASISSSVSDASVTAPPRRQPKRDSVLALEQAAAVAGVSGHDSARAADVVLALGQTELIAADARGAAPLPGEKHVDEALLDRVVAELNQLYLQKTQEVYESIGAYLAQTFFSGDVTLFESREKHHQTWRALAKREDLHFSHSTLWYAVAMCHQAQALPEPVVRALSTTHQRRLTHVRDPEQKRALAERVVAEGLTERQLREAILESRPMAAQDAPRRGRPPMTKLQKQLAVVSRALGESEGLEGMVGELADEAVPGVLASVREMMRRLELVLAGLEGRG